mmetsp:Transcript_68185/g.211284  ORF Transcript_68185/g.211284 Transcript_68185/m.211284 type:complete len:462 (+) Transcript_68185:70-1455(+)
MARRGDADVAEQIKQCFREFDRDGNGAICRSELEDVLQRLCHKGQSLTKDDIQLCLSQADKNGDGVIGYDEFVDWLMRPGARIQPKKGGIAIFDMEEVLRPLFHTFDRNGNGVISYEEFEECFCILQNAVRMHSQAEAAAPDPAMLEKEARAVFRRADSSMDNKITFEEFSKWQLGLLEKSGLLNEDIKDLVPALARQLQRVFKLSESNEKGQLTNADQNVLMHITKNLANFSRDIYNDAEAGHSSLRGRHHYKNRWTEPPVGLNLDRLKGLHLKLATVPTWGVEDLNLSVLCVPEVDTRDARHRRWIARIVRQVTYKTGRQEIDEPQYYVYEALNWTSNEDLAPEFDQCLACLPPELRLFCLLKAEANFGVQIGWNSVQVALKRAVQMGLLTAEQQTLYTRHTDSIVMRTLRERSMSKPSAGEVERLRSQTTCAPRHVMAALSELGILKVSSVWADVLKA